MAELKFKILGDMSQLKNDIKNLFKEKFKIGVQGGGGSGGGGGGKKIASALGGILKNTFMALGPLALLAKLADIFKIFDLLFGFLFIGFMNLMRFIKKIPEGLKSIWTIIVTWLKFGWDLMKNKLLELKDKLISTIKEWWAKAIEWLKNLPAMIWEWIKGLPALIWDWLKGGFNLIVEWLKTGWDLLTAKLTDVISRLKELWDVSKEWLSKLWTKLKELPKFLWEKLKTGFQWARDKLADVIKWIKKLPQLIWDKLKALGSTIANAIKSVLPSFLGGGKSKKVDDAIITSKGDVIRTNPNDTIIATQNPGAGGGVINITFNGLTMDDAFEKLSSLLSTQKIRATRF